VRAGANETERVTLRAYRPNRVDVRELFALAAPVVLVQIGLMAMGAVDTIMVGRVSAVGLAAVAIGSRDSTRINLVTMLHSLVAS